MEVGASAQRNFHQRGGTPQNGTLQYCLSSKKETPKPPISFPNGPREVPDGLPPCSQTDRVGTSAPPFPFPCSSLLLGVRRFLGPSFFYLVPRPLLFLDERPLSSQTLLLRVSYIKKISFFPLNKLPCVDSLRPTCYSGVKGPM